MSKSTAYIIAEGIDYVYRFCGVTEIEYNFALNIDADTSQGGDIINGARRLPNQIRLSVVETDVASQSGWSASMLAALDSIRRNRDLGKTCCSRRSPPPRTKRTNTAGPGMLCSCNISRAANSIIPIPAAAGEAMEEAAAPPLPPVKRRIIPPPREILAQRPPQAWSAAPPHPLSAAHWRQCWGELVSEWRVKSGEWRY